MILYLQQFLQNKFNNDLIVSKQIKVVYIQTVANSSFPYAYIGDFNSKNISTKSNEINEIYFKVNIYSRDKNIKNILEASKHIKELLNINNEFRVVLLRYLNEAIQLHNDGVTHQIIMNFKAIIKGE